MRHRAEVNQKKKKWKKILSTTYFLFLILATVFSMPQKTQALSWTQVNTDGFGDAGNWGNVHLAVHQSKIYAFLANNSGAQIWRSENGTSWNSITTDGFGDTNNNYFGRAVEFNGYLYIATTKTVASGEGAEIWRSASGDSGSWVQVNSDGFGDNKNRGIEAGLITYNGYLYAGTCYNSTTGAEVWRSSNGTEWTQVNTDGFGSNSNSCIRTIGVFNNQLYVGVDNTSAGGSIYRTSNGTTWEQVVSEGFGDSNNASISLLQEFGDYLYAGTINETTGTELWRSSSGNSGTWSQVNTDGFGNAHNTWTGFHGAVVNNTFWVGVRNDTDGASLWRSSNGTSWSQEGSNGFGDTGNYALYAITFKERLYIGFSNAITGVEIWRSEPLTLLSISTDSLPDGTVGASYSTTLTANSGTPPYTFSYAGYLPPGLSLSSSGVISGTPTQQGTYTFTVTVTDSGTPAQTASKDYAIAINLAPTQELPETGPNIPQSYLWILPGGSICLGLISLYFLKNLRK